MDNIIILERLFPFIEKSKLTNLKIDKESISYITTPVTAKYITSIITEYSKQCNFTIESILDCTGCIGGDTIALGKAFNSVQSIEIDTERCEMLQNNVNIYELKNVTVVNECCIDYIKKSVSSDVIYIDPPWGGSNYKNNEVTKLSIGNITIEEFTLGLFNGMFSEGCPKLLAMKLPKNYDYSYFCKIVNENKDMKIIKHKLPKIDLLIVMKKINYLIRD